MFIMSVIGTATKQIPTIIRPTINKAITKKRLVHLITSGPPRAMRVPRRTQRVPRIGAHTPLSKPSPKLFPKWIIELAKRLAATAYQPKLAKLIMVDSKATPFFPRTALNQIHKSIPYLTANKIGRHSIKTQIMLKLKIFINI